MFAGPSSALGGLGIGAEDEWDCASRLLETEVEYGLYTILERVRRELKTLGFDECEVLSYSLSTLCEPKACLTCRAHLEVTQGTLR